MSESVINVHSEVGRLKTVMLHRPGKELENLMPDYLEELLFDDIPFLEDAQAEHDQFATILRDNGVEVVYLIDLVAEAIDASETKSDFIETWLNEANIHSLAIRELISDFLHNLEDTKSLVAKTIEGFKRSEILTDLTGEEDPAGAFYVNPMPNLYFTRDPFATIGHGVSLNRMYAKTRQRETIYGRYIFTHHLEYGNKKTPIHPALAYEEWIEGGDILVISEEVMMIGVSQRTQLVGIERLARYLFDTTDFKQIITMDIDKTRKFMHLDTVFTMVDYDKFVIHPEIEVDLKVSILEQQATGELTHVVQHELLDQVLAKALKVPNVTLIRGGDGDAVVAAREQWNDGANTLAIAPGEIIVYHRNVTTNRQLMEAGVKLHLVRGSELVRGRGGPRCMSMPLKREPVKPW